MREGNSWEVTLDMILITTLIGYLGLFLLRPDRPGWQWFVGIGGVLWLERHITGLIKSGHKW